MPDAALVDAFDDLEQAANAHAYLSGFLLELLSDARGESPILTARFVRDLLHED